jgi:hypothetical protein
MVKKCYDVYVFLPFVSEVHVFSSHFSKSAPLSPSYITYTSCLILRNFQIKKAEKDARNINLHFLELWIFLDIEQKHPGS